MTYLFQKKNRSSRNYKAMEQIRALYRFSSASQEVQAAIDAGRHMKIESELAPLEYSIVKMFKEDYRDFIALAEEIRKKYAAKASALQTLIAR
jgi:hypothetical protein